MRFPLLAHSDVTQTSREDNSPSKPAHIDLPWVWNLSPDRSDHRWEDRFWEQASILRRPDSPGSVDSIDQREQMSVWSWLRYGCGESGLRRTVIVSATGASENAEAKGCTGEQAMMCSPHTPRLWQWLLWSLWSRGPWVRKSWGNISLTSRKWKSHSQFWTEFLVWKWGLLLTM